MKEQTKSIPTTADCVLAKPNPKLPDLPFDAQLQHRYWGIGLALVTQADEREMCQVVLLSYDGYHPTHRPVYAWRKCLSVMLDGEDNPIPIGENKPLQELREQVAKQVDTNAPLVLA